MATYKDIRNSYDILWDSSIKTGDFTAVSKAGYFINTTSGVVVMTLPASPNPGDFVAAKDYARTFATNKLSINGNGQKIQGDTANSALDQNGDTVILVYIDSTKGWLYTQENTVTPVSNAEYVIASGGTETTVGDYKVHVFNSSGTFTVNQAGNAAGSDSVDYMVIGGGGGGGVFYGGGGGGAGGFRESVPACAAWTASPRANPGGALPVSVTAYPITVGGGGSPATRAAWPWPRYTPGSASSFSTITSAGGGGGSCVNYAPTCSNKGGPGGSGGGTFGFNGGTAPGGAGNSPPVTPPQGSPGSPQPGSYPSESLKRGSGGGGATATGSQGSTGPGAGGAGATTAIVTGSPASYAGGGGGGGAPSQPAVGSGGTGGGGRGAPGTASPFPAAGVPGTSNTGGGGGGGGCGAPGPSVYGGSGGSGKVVIRYKFQN